MMDDKQIEYKQNILDCLKGIVGPIFKVVDRLVDNNIKNDNDIAVKTYWRAFKRNTRDTASIIDAEPDNLAQVMMSFRLLQEMSADIFYLAHHKDNINNLIKSRNNIEQAIKNKDVTIRNMADTIYATDIRKDDKADGTEKRLEYANQFLDDNLFEGIKEEYGISDDLKEEYDIAYKLFCGYIHFNPAAIYWRNALNSEGYVTLYNQMFILYPAWIYLVIYSLSELLGIEELGKERCKGIFKDMKMAFREGKWSVTKKAEETK